MGHAIIYYHDRLIPQNQAVSDLYDELSSGQYEGSFFIMTRRVNKVTGAEFLRGNVVPISQPGVSSTCHATPEWEEPLTGFLLWKKANGTQL